MNSNNWHNKISACRKIILFQVIKILNQKKLAWNWHYLICTGETSIIKRCKNDNITTRERSTLYPDMAYVRLARHGINLDNIEQPETNKIKIIYTLLLYQVIRLKMTWQLLYLKFFWTWSLVVKLLGCLFTCLKQRKKLSDWSLAVIRWSFLIILSAIQN